MSRRHRRLLPWVALASSTWSGARPTWPSASWCTRCRRWPRPPCASWSPGVVMAGIAAIVDRRPRPADAAADARTTRSSACCCSRSATALVMWAEKRIPSSIAALIVATVPLWLTLLDGLRPAASAGRCAVWIGNADRPRRRGAGGAARRAASTPATGRPSSRCRSRRSAWTVGLALRAVGAAAAAAVHRGRDRDAGRTAVLLCESL